jgi:hypothetical protein
MEIFELLDKSNCRECGEKTCLAFAGAVFQGKRKLADCPKLEREIIERFSEGDQNNVFQEGADYLEELKNKVAAADLAEAAEKVGAKFSGDKLTLKVLGKDFSVDTEGNLSVDIHINPWVAVPFLSYILYGRGLPVSGNWISFRELKDGQERYPLFQKRCEQHGPHIQRKTGGKTIQIRYIRRAASAARSSHYDLLLAARGRAGIQSQCLF